MEPLQRFRARLAAPAALLVVAAAVTHAASCGGETAAANADAGAADADVKDGTTRPGSGGDAASGSFDFDATPDAGYDAWGWLERPDVAIPEAGPVLVTACVDASVACPFPASVCLDDYDLQYYQGGLGCSDAATCVFTPVVVRCPPSPSPPDCFQGGCHPVIVR
jgi:hypothetical protein